MSTTVPTQLAKAHAGMAVPVPAMSEEHFFHAAAAGQPDEAALATWWCRFRDPELNRLVDAALIQGYELCAAALRLQSRCAHAANGNGADAHSDTPAIDDQIDEAALYHYYSVRLRQIATVARHYFLVLTLQERMACTDAAIAAEAAAMRRAHPTNDSDGTAMHAGDLRPAMLADLHAHRLRLRAQWDAAVIALSHQTAQPLSMLVARLSGRLLPGASAESPALGGPAHVRLRRPDLLAQTERAAAAGQDGFAARLAALACEQREDLALKEVELALATLAATRAELVPVRASAASAEAYRQRLHRSADPHIVAEGARAVHAYRDREIETRGRGYLALVDAFHAAGCGWPVLSDPMHTELMHAESMRSEPERPA
jgi:hypothetical protein